MRREDLPIPIPCTENWDTMTVEGKRLFCGACKTHVHDLTRMSDEEAQVLVFRRDQEPMCVRYLHDAHGNLVFRMIDTRLVPTSRLALAKRALALGGAAIGVSTIVACASAPPPGPQMLGGAVACPMPDPPPSSAFPPPPAPSSSASGSALLPVVPGGGSSPTTGK